MNDLTDAVAALSAALAVELDASLAAELDAARRTAGVRQQLVLAARVAELAGQTGPLPPPSPGPVPAGAVVLRVGSSTYPLAAVNPTAVSNPAGAGFPPGFRGQDQAIAVQAPAGALTTNGYGMTVLLDAAGRLVATHDDQPAATVTTMVSTPVPPGGAVVSLHGAARAWGLAVLKPGTLVQFDQPPPVIVVDPPAGGRVIAGYLMDGQDVDTIPDVYTQIRAAFFRLTGGVLTPVEWGGKTPAQTQAQLTSWAGARPGNQVLLATGGSGGGNNFGQPTAFVAGYKSLAPKYKARGVDADEEGVLDGARVVAVCKDLHAAGLLDVASFVPPGGPPVPVALSAAKQVHDAGVPVQFGFQGYDAVDSDDDILGRTADAVAVLGEASVMVGFMIGDDPKHRTPAECESLMRKVVARWPRIRGAYFWQMKAPRTTEAARLVAAVLGA